MAASHTLTPPEPARFVAWCRAAATATLMAWLSTLAQAQGSANPAELARSRACLACHQVDKPRAGPALRDIAKRYRDQPQAEARLAKKLREGGPAVWQMPMGPMPAQTRLSEAEARVLVRWVLATP